MHLYDGRGTKGEIDSIKMLKRVEPVIGTGEWGSYPPSSASDH